MCWVDIDRDGNLDLYVANYQKFTFDKHFQQRIGDYLFHPGPKDFPPEDHFLYRNLGDGTFVDVSESAGIRVAPKPGMGVIAGDFNAEPQSEVMHLLSMDCNIFGFNQPAIPTFPSGQPTKQIDYIVAYPSRSVQVMSVAIAEHTLASDHLPLLAVVQLQSE